MQNRQEKSARARKERENHLILKIISESKVTDQIQLLREFKAKGIFMTQATLSRWLNKLGVIKPRRLLYDS